MARIIIEYDGRSVAAKKLIDFIMSLNIVKVLPVNGIDEAIEDVKNGKVYKAANAKDLLEKCLK